MAWNTPKVSVENIEVYSSDINLNTDNIESDLILLEALSTTANTALNIIAGVGTTFVTTAINLAAAVTNTDLVATPGVSNHLEIYEVYLRSGGSGTVTLQDESSDLTGIMPVGTNDLIFLPKGILPRFVLPTNEAFQVDSTADAALDGYIISATVAD